MPLISGHFENDLARLATTIREEVSLVSKQAQSDEIKENSGFRAPAVKFSDKAAQELQEARRLKSRKAKSQFLDACPTYNHQTAWKQGRKAGTTNTKRGVQAMETGNGLQYFMVYWYPGFGKDRSLGRGG